MLWSVVSKAAERSRRKRFSISTCRYGKSCKKRLANKSVRPVCQ